MIVYNVVLWRYSLLSFEVVEKDQKYSFGAQIFFVGGLRNFTALSVRLTNTIWQVWLSSVSWLPVRSVATKQNAEFSEVDKNFGYRPFVDSSAFPWLSTACLTAQLFAVKSWSRRKMTQSIYFWALFSYGSFSAIYSLSTLWRSLIEFDLLTSMSESWQWNRIYLGVKFLLLDICRPKFKKFWESVGTFEVFNAVSHYLYRVSFRRFSPFKLSLTC